MTDRFSVHQFFPDGTNECVGEHMLAEGAVLTARDYILRPAAKIGVIAKVMIVDAGDYCVFEWRYGEGIVFPPDLKKKEQKQ